MNLTELKTYSLDEITSAISFICTQIPTNKHYKGHGCWNTYEDDKIVIRYDTYYPNMDVKIKNSLHSTVFSKGGGSSPSVFKTGKWVNYIMEVILPIAQASKSAKDEERRKKEEELNQKCFAPIDDNVLFS